MIRNASILVIMGLVTEGAAALSLGAPQGKVLLGQPVDLSFEVQLDPGMSVDALCPQVRLVSGDMPVPAGRVQVSVRPGELERNPVLRVQSSYLADEPVLTAQVSIHCTSRVTREYTFLADLPATVAAGVRPVAIPWYAPAPEASLPRSVVAAPEKGAFAPETGSSPQRRDSANGRAERRVARPSVRPVARSPSGHVGAAASTVSGTKSEPARAAPAARAAAEAVSAPVAKAAASSAASVSPAVASAATGPAKPRLVMEPLAALVTPSVPSEPVPSDTVVSVQAPPLAPEGNALGGTGSDSARMEALQSEIERMRAQAEQDRQATLALLTRMEQLSAGRFPASLVYGLLALLTLTVGAAGWGLMRMRRAMDASNEEWRNTLTAYVAQSSVPLAGEGEPERPTDAPPADGRPTGLASLHGAGVLPA